MTETKTLEETLPLVEPTPAEVLNRGTVIPVRFTKEEKENAYDLSDWNNDPNFEDCGSYDEAVCRTLGCGGPRTHKPNLAELQAVADRIFSAEAQKISGIRWRQSVWGQVSKLVEENGVRYTPAHCGTAFCFAGHGVLFDRNAELAIDGWQIEVYEEELAEEGCAEPIGLDDVFYRGADGTVYRANIGTYATHLFGLTNEESDRLFQGYNGLKDLAKVLVPLGVEVPEEYR